ncbi:MAG: cysteine rich repeat-containing protein [Rhodomicrobium sp.]
MQTTIKIVATTFALSAVFALPAFSQEKAHRLAACKADVEKFCASEPRGQGKVRACLEANKDKVSPECKTALDQGKSQ